MNLLNEFIGSILEATPKNKSVAPTGLYAGSFGNYYTDPALKQYAGKVKGGKWIPASQEPEETKEPAKKTKKAGPPDFNTVVSTLGKKVVGSVNNIITRALSKQKKSAVLAGDGDQKMAVLNGVIKSVGQSVTATGPVHEVTIGLALDIILKHPELEVPYVTRLLTEKLKDTKLGSSLGTKLYETVNKAVMSAKAESVRVRLGMQKNKMDSASTVTEHYHGNAQSKSKLDNELSKLVSSGYTVYTSDGKSIDPADISELIKEAGSSAHGDYTTPGDSFLVSVDPKTKKIILGTSSNKTSRNDQSLNTTVLKELTDYRDSLKVLVSSGAVNEKDLQKVEKQLEVTDATIKGLSAQVSNAFAAPVTALQDSKIRKKFIEYVTTKSTEGVRKNLPSYYSKVIKPYMEFDPRKKKLSKKDEKILSSLKSAGWAPGKKITADMATAAWVQDMSSRMQEADVKGGLNQVEAKLVERYFNASGEAKVDTTQIRMKALDALQKRHAALQNVSCTLEGKSVPVSSAVLGIFTVRALHLEESLSGIPGNSKVYTKYRCFFKAVTGDIIGYPDSNRKTLGVDSFGEFCSQLSISTPKISQKRGAEIGEAGNITFDIISVNKEGKKMSICARVIRTKGSSSLAIVAVPLKDYTDSLASNQPTV